MVVDDVCWFINHRNSSIDISTINHLVGGLEHDF